MGKKAIIDRFEGDQAILELEEGEFMDIERSALPPEAREGSIISIGDEGYITVLDEETRSRREEVEDLLDRLFE